MSLRQENTLSDGGAPARAAHAPQGSEAPGRFMGGKLKAQEELKRANEDGGNVPRSEVDDRGEKLPREARPEKRGSIEVLAGENGCFLHGDVEDNRKRTAMGRRGRRFASNCSTEEV